MMTSIHLNSGESQTSTPNSTNLNGGLNQIQANPNRYDDEAERRRQLREALSRHHAETTQIHQRTQPMIDDQIHEDTLKYLKTGPVNGTKAKSQKPRAPKRQRSTASNTSANPTNINPSINNNGTTTNNNSNNCNSSNNNNASNGLNQYIAQTPARPIGISNNPHQHYAGLPQMQHQNQLINQQQPMQQQLQQPMQQSIPQQQRHGQSLHPQSQHIMQQASPQLQPSMTVGMQPMQHMSTFSPSSQQSIHIQPQQQNQMHQPQSYNDNYQNGYQTQPIYQRTQQHMQQIPQADQHTQPIEQSHHHYMNMPSNTFAQQNQQSFYPPQIISNTTNHSLPTDLDLNLQAGLECDVESLIKHEISVEGQLEFNQDLLVKLDNYYYHQPNYQ